MFREKKGRATPSGSARDQGMASQLAGLVDAWAGGRDVADAVWEVGSLYALDGESLRVLLDDVDATREASRLPPADLDMVRSLALAWSEAALSRYARLTCTDPLTGLATAQHLQTQVAGLSRGQQSGLWVMVVVEVGQGTPPAVTDAVPPAAVEVIRWSEVATVVAGELIAEVTVARLHPRRCAALVPREEASRLVTLIDRRLREHSYAAHIWIERLPEKPAHAAALVDELCR